MALKRSLRRAALYLLALPRSLYFNLRHLPFAQAIRLPILLSHRVYVREMSGTILLEGPIKPARIRIGFGNVEVFDWRHSDTVLDISGTLRFLGKAKLGHGTKLRVAGELVLGNDFNISAEVAIVCYSKISFGSNNLVGWDTLIMDHDYHKIKTLEGEYLNPPTPITFGDNVWVGCRVVILKGSAVGNSCVVAADSLLIKAVAGDNLLIGGKPARVLRSGITWEH